MPWIYHFWLRYTTCREIYHFGTKLYHNCTEIYHSCTTLSLRYTTFKVVYLSRGTLDIPLYVLDIPLCLLDIPLWHTASPWTSVGCAEAPRGASVMPVMDGLETLHDVLGLCRHDTVVQTQLRQGPANLCSAVGTLLAPWTRIQPNRCPL